MTNPVLANSFNAAMLLRGLRAMDAALGENYNVTSHTCEPSPVVYDSAFPKDGINFSTYPGGFEGVKGVWKGWMYENGGKGDRKASVHEDVEDTVVKAFEIFERIDKAGTQDGNLTLAEWEKAQKGHKPDDVLFDLEYLQALKNVTAKMIALEKGEALNPANPDTYPELQAARAEKAALEASMSKEIQYYKNAATIAGAVSAFLLIGLIVSLVTRKSGSNAASAPAKKDPPSLPTAGFLKDISKMGFDPDTLIFALRKVDPRLAHHFERNGKGLNHEAKPITTVGELAERIHGKDKNALKKAEGVIKTLGPIGDGDNPVLAIFELIVASANYSFVDSATRQVARQRFVAEMNSAGGLADALSNSTPPPPPTVAGIEETKAVHAYEISDKVINDALEKFDTATGAKLAEFYRANLASTDNTIKALLDKVAVRRAEAVKEAYESVTLAGILNTYSEAMNEQFILELIVKASGLAITDPATYSTAMGQFITDVKAANGIVKPTAKTKVV